MYRFRHAGLLGTMIDLAVDTTDGQLANDADRFVVGEFQRLQQVFSIFEVDSEISRWRRHELTNLSEDLSELLHHTRQWQEFTGGLFNPLVGRLTSIWKIAEQEGVVPDAQMLDATAESIRTPLSTTDGGSSLLTDDRQGFSLNAIAKGFIVDKVMSGATSRFDLNQIIINAGGDVAQSGLSPTTIGIQNPLRPFDNEAPIATVKVHNSAVATSGSSRRGFVIQGERFSHIINPLTGKPADGAASVTVLAADAMTADVVATAICLLPPAAGLAFCDQHNVGGLIVEKNGAVTTNSRWREFSS